MHLINTLRRIWNWEPDENNEWIIALRTMKLDGIKDALKPGTNCFIRICWIIIYVALAYFTGQIIWQSYHEFTKHPILYAFPDGVSVSNIPFPAITVSPSYLIKQSQLQKAYDIWIDADINGYYMGPNNQTWTMSAVGTLIHFIHHLCEPATSFLKQMNMVDEKRFVAKSLLPDLNEFHTENLFDDAQNPTYTENIVPFIKNGLLDCNEILAGCIWKGKMRKCEDLFVRDPTDVGTGCSFNKIPQEVLKKGDGIFKLLHRRENTAKLSREHKMWRKWAVEDISNSRKEEESENEMVWPQRQIRSGRHFGVSFMLTFEQGESTDFACPIFDGTGYMIDIHSPLEQSEIENKGIAIPPNHEVFIHIKAVLTLASDQIRLMDIEDRKCYFSNEKQLKYYEKYTTGNCRKECLSEKIFQSCNCYRISETLGRKERICVNSDASCVQNVTDLFSEHGYEEMCEFLKCYPTCVDITYHKQSSAIPYKLSEFTNFRNLNLNKNQNTSIVHIYYTDETMETRERKRQYDWIEILGLVGGILGLTLGWCIMRTFNVVLGLFMIFANIWRRLRKCCKMSRVSSYSATAPKKRKARMWASKRLKIQQNKPKDVPRSSERHPRETIVDMDDLSAPWVVIERRQSATRVQCTNVTVIEMEAETNVSNGFHR